MIYVDELRTWPRYVINAFKYKRGAIRSWCWMVTDGPVEELHDLAKKIGVSRTFFVDDTLPHYDLVPMRRMMAVDAGAKVVTSEDVEVMRKRRVAELRGEEGPAGAGPSDRT